MFLSRVERQGGRCGLFFSTPKATKDRGTWGRGRCLPPPVQTAPPAPVQTASSPPLHSHRLQTWHLQTPPRSALNQAGPLYRLRPLAPVQAPPPYSSTDCSPSPLFSLTSYRPGTSPPCTNSTAFCPETDRPPSTGSSPSTPVQTPPSCTDSSPSPTPVQTPPPFPQHSLISAHPEYRPLWTLQPALHTGNSVQPLLLWHKIKRHRKAAAFFSPGDESCMWEEWSPAAPASLRSSSSFCFLFFFYFGEKNPFVLFVILY